jgi:hypothetical protein
MQLYKGRGSLVKNNWYMSKKIERAQWNGCPYQESEEKTPTVKVGQILFAKDKLVVRKSVRLNWIKIIDPVRTAQ